MKTTEINNRRYLGNKYRLLPFITQIVSEQCSGVRSVADIFAGTGAVASGFTAKRLVLNDILYSNYICHYAWFSPNEYSAAKVTELVSYYNTSSFAEANYMSDNFADTYFSDAACRQIGNIRADIEHRFDHQDINPRERALLITALLYAADKIANTCGHYDAYRRNSAPKARLTLAVPTPLPHLNAGNQCFNEDSNQVISHIEADLVYLDPPYNSRQYCDTFHVLENIARWQQPPVAGIARKMDRTELKSAYCTNKATAAFAKLVQSINAPYILMSYNNMSQKGNNRSNAKLNDTDILDILHDKGKVQVFTQSFKPFTAGKSALADHAERLFLCTCR
ncbi:MAG: DNA adenine methylase [Cellulomonadaceae bacterium]|jgi:adenine-specific DNA-methyltransferase|nr:DNA adenine methylase [Cellulomonadaceae bacterium]